MTTEFRRLTVAVLVAAFALIVAGTAAAWLVPQLRVLNVVVMAGLVSWWIVSLLRGMDRVDLAVVAVVMAAGVATMASILPRLSIEAFFGCLAYAAVFGLVRRLGEERRDAALRALQLLTAVLVPLLLVTWSATWLRWLDATGWAVPPPLSIRLPSDPFEHPHDAALLIGLIAPSLFAVRYQDTNRLAKVGVGVLACAAAAVLLMSGGRGIWLGAVVATVVVVVLSGRAANVWASVRARWLPVGAVVLAVVVGLVVAGVGASVVARAAGTATIDQRAAIWGAAAETFLDRPLTGTGPGTFQFALHATDYYDRDSFAPNDADSLFVQVPAELGILGAVALVVLGVVVVAAWRDRRPTLVSIWALTFALVVGLAANPAALGFGALLVAFWAGIATPWSGQPLSLRSRRPLVWIAAAGMAVAAIPLVLSTWAAVEFDAAQSHVAAGSDTEALSSLDAAIALDPAFPLYRRARGIHLLDSGQAGEAIADLERAAALNPLDAATWRALALAAVAAGDPGAAGRAADRAVDLHWTDELNHAARAHVAAAVGDDATADRASRDLALVAPWAGGDARWAEAIPTSDPASAFGRAAAEVAVLAETDIDPRWVMAMTGVDAPDDGSMRDLSRSQRALSLLVACDPNAARAELDAAARQEAGGDDYWIVSVIVSSWSGEAAGPAREALRILAPFAQSDDPQAGSPVSAGVADESGYARRSISMWDGVRLPSHRAGQQAWLDEPAEALRRIGAACD